MYLNGSDFLEIKNLSEFERFNWTWNQTEVTGGTAFGRIIERIDEFNNRTDFDDCDGNEIGQEFQGNIITNDFDDNKIGNYFSNIMSTSFTEMSISKSYLNFFHI